MIDARDKLTGLIRRAIEDEARLELVTSPGKPTRGGYDTTWMFAQNGTATSLTIEAEWFPEGAAFTLTGPAVEQADEAFWAAHGVRRSHRYGTGGPLESKLFVLYANGDRSAGQLLTVLPALVAPRHAETAGAYARADRTGAQENPAESLPEETSPGGPAVKAQDASGRAAQPAGEPPVTISWTTTEVREYKETFTLGELRAAGLTVRNGQLQQTVPPRSHWETPDRFLAAHEGPATQKAGYIASRVTDARPAHDAGHAAGRHEPAATAPAGEPDVTAAPAARQGVSPARRAAGSNVAANAAQGRSRGLR